MSYKLSISPRAQEEVKRLPGHLRGRVRQAIQELRENPRPSRTRQLELEMDLVGVEPRRLRIEQWRVIYAIIETEVQLVAVLAVRRRPPYDYQDLPELFTDLV